MRNTMVRIAMAALLAMAVGCDQGTSGGATDNGAADNGVVADAVETADTLETAEPDTAVAPDPAVAETTPDTAAEAEAEAPEALIAVIHGTETKVIDVATLATVDVEGTPVVPLSEVVKAAFPAIVLTQVTVDFTGAEGYKPGSKSNCVGVIPIPGKSLEQGWIDPATTLIFWDETLGFPGCLSIKLATEIILADI